MLDAKILRNNIEYVSENLQRRGFILDIDFIQEHEKQRKEIQQQLEDLQHKRNCCSKKIGKCKARGEDASNILTEVSSLGEQINILNGKLKVILEELNNYLLTIPNLLDDTVPFGNNEEDNRLVRSYGERTAMSFIAKEHYLLPIATSQMQFEKASKISGSRFTIFTKQLAKLHRALAQFMLDVHTEEHDYEEVYLPLIVNHDTMQKSGQLPKFAEDAYKIEDLNSYLIPTAEVPLCNLVADSILDIKDLPLKYVSHTACFRKEAGSYGRDTSGIIRQHQFDKVELVIVCHPEQSNDLLEHLTMHAENILKKLSLPYRVMELCSKDIGFCAKKTYDLEVWLPGQNKYREISSCSNCGDFQARRMQTRANINNGKQLLHTLNGSGLAVGRTMVAILENYQQEDGSIMIPEVLQPYMGHLTTIR